VFLAVAFSDTASGFGIVQLMLEAMFAAVLGFIE